MARDNTLLLNDVAFLEHNLIRFLAPFRTISTAALFGTVFLCVHTIHELTQMYAIHMIYIKIKLCHYIIINRKRIA